MKICYCTTISLTLKAFILECAKFLHEEKGWDISFICSEDEVFANSLPDYIHYYPVKMRRGINLDGVRAIYEINKICRREKYDIVQYSTPNASLYASIAATMAGIKTRLYCQWGMVYVGFDGFRRKLFRAVERFVCGLSTFVEPDSLSNLKFAREEGLYPEEKSGVIWNGSACGVNLEKFDISKKTGYREAVRAEYNIPPEAFVFGFVGRITRDKGINELLDAFKRIRDNRDDVYLMLVGPAEPDATADENLIEWAKRDKNVLFTGFSPRVEQMLSAMDTYILPSYREGFGMGIVEAEAMGVPVIATDIPGPRDAMIPEITGKLIPKGDTAALFDAMQEMLDKPDNYGENGIAFARERFDQKQFFEYIVEDRERLVAVYRK